MIKKLIVLFVAFMVTNSSSIINNPSYRIELELPHLNNESKYVDVHIINHGFQIVSKNRVYGKSAIIDYEAQSGDLLNTVLFIKNKGNNFAASTVRLKIYYKNSLIYTYWSHSDQMSSDFLDTTNPKIPIEF
ncbi:MAG: hypothetical protein KDD94_14510, partial [Calditrichaeota bacterium]|nr:hypothetical protein [Calditrichota bacterium]